MGWSIPGSTVDVHNKCTYTYIVTVCGHYSRLHWLPNPPPNQVGAIIGERVSYFPVVWSDSALAECVNRTQLGVVQNAQYGKCASVCTQTIAELRNKHIPTSIQCT